MGVGSRTFQLLGAAVVAAVVSASCAREATAPAGDAASPIAVTTASVAMADIADTFEAGGVVQARTTATLTARILAPIREVRVAAGDRVRAGQPLVTLDGRDLSAQARGAQAGVRAAEQAALAATSDRQAADAALTLARATEARIAALHAKRSATPQELDEATAARSGAEARAAGSASRVQQAAAALDAAQSAAEATDATATYAVVAAPFDGVVTEVPAEVGNMASPGMPLVRLDDTRGYRLEVRIDESRIGPLTSGAPVEVALDTVAGASALTVRGVVAEVARAVESDARAVLVKITLPPTDGLRSGQFGRARVAGASHRALTLPTESLVQRGQLTAVFVVEQGVARMRLVSLRGREVLAGVTEKEQVILSPPPSLADGRRVTEGGPR